MWKFEGKYEVVFHFIYNLKNSKIIIEDCGEIKKNVVADMNQIQSYVPPSLRE